MLVLLGDCAGMFSRVFLTFKDVFGLLYINIPLFELNDKQLVHIKNQGIFILSYVFILCLFPRFNQISISEEIESPGVPSPVKLILKLIINFELGE